MILRRLGIGQARRALGPFVGPRYKWLFVLTVVLGLVLGGVEATILTIIGELVGSIEDSSSARSFGPFADVSVGQLTAIGAGATVLLAMLRALETGLIGRIGVHPLTTARSRLLSSFLYADHRSQQAVATGTYHELMSANAMRFSSMGMATATMVSSAVVAIALAVAAAFVSPIGFALLAGAMLLVVLLTAPMNGLAQRLGGALAGSNRSLANASVELVDVATDARQYGVEDRLFEVTNRQVHNVSKSAFRNHLVTSYGSSLFQVLMLGVLVGLAGAVASIDGTGFAEAGTVALLALRSQMAARKAVTANLSIAASAPFAIALAEQIDRLPRRPTGGTETAGPIVRFEASNISFQYHDEGDESGPVQLLSGVDLVVDRGEHVGIIGPSGSGKSTFLALLLGEVQPDSGAILINGKDRTLYDDASVRSKIAAVQQRPRLVSASVADNIRFFRDDLTDDDIVSAASSAGILDEVLSWPEGLDTMIGERGTRQVSGGQAQRICIARALASDPTLLVMDEPTSSIDESGEQLIVDALGALGDHCAAIIVSHRPTALASCSRVLKLEGNRLVPFAADTDGSLP